MTGPRPDELKKRARRHFGIADDVPAAAWPVYDPDGADPRYVLVEIGHPAAIVAVAAMDAATGALLNAVRLPGAGPHLGITPTEAIERAGLPGGGTVRLVWTPSRQSRSPLYPVWEVRSGSAVLYVDQQGHPWPALEAGGKGGA